MSERDLTFLAPSPTVSEAMREAVALVLGGALIDAGLGRAIGVVAFDRIAGILLAPAGPIASALAALERENATLRAERDGCAGLAGEALGQSMVLLAIHERWKDASVDESAARIITVICDECREAAQASEVRAIAAEAKLATLWASAERMEAALRPLAEEADFYDEPVDGVPYLPDRTPLVGLRLDHARAARAALTPKETPDA